MFEVMARDAEHHVAIHLDEPAVGVVCESRASALGRETDDGAIIEPQVEDRLHHPGHGDGRTGPYRHEKRVAGVAEALARRLLEPLKVAFHFLAEGTRDRAISEIAHAHIARDGESRGHRHAEVRHLGEVRPLAAEDALHVACPVGLAVAEEVDRARNVGRGRTAVAGNIRHAGGHGHAVRGGARAARGRD
jgi:hypothetical protein